MYNYQLIIKNDETRGQVLCFTFEAQNLSPRFHAILQEPLLPEYPHCVHAVLVYKKRLPQPRENEPAFLKIDYCIPFDRQGHPCNGGVIVKIDQYKTFIICFIYMIGKIIVAAQHRQFLQCCISEKTGGRIRSKRVH